ncbi:DEAD/DEAH box helicase [Brevibacillus borstelensis]|uniref:DEAD/DEAH box helicase n=1 Tax=Brevibacillus borstelensis TaxID=45462 RepID=UPI0030BFD2C3
MNPFYLLSKSMQKKIWDMKWGRFTPIQEMVIPTIIHTNKDIVISSGTASGKTEAAFLPILTLIESTAGQSLKVIYISPLKALINNQFERIEKVSEHIHVPIHRWHGDVDQGKKKKFIQSPAGILQITPESIESLFVNRTEHIKRIFSDVEFFVIDEIHSFLDTERGVQLRSLLSRIENYCKNRPRIIGLSATIDNFDFIRSWINYCNTDNVEIIVSPGNDKELNYSLMHFQNDESFKKPVVFFEDLRELTRESKSIIFCNSRGEVEETTVFLNRLAKRENVGETYYAHHSSIDKQEREYVERTIANSSAPKSVVATSSLELGIDIGEIELVVQVDSTFTVSSLKQRLGRSGRKKDTNQYLQLYTTNQDSLLQSLAVMELLLEKWVEPSVGYPVPYDILFQQIVSICQEHNGITEIELINNLKGNHVFYFLPTEEIRMLIHHMINYDFLELINGSKELIVGLDGERILRDKDFYSVFMTSEEYEVVNGAKKIGQLDKKWLINEGDNIILAGKLWTIQGIEESKGKVYVTAAVNANPPRYFGDGSKIHSKISEKMHEILCSDEKFRYINKEALNELNDLRKAYHLNNIKSQQRVLWKQRDSYYFEGYTGTKIARTLVWMLRSFGVQVKKYDEFGRLEVTSSIYLLGTLEQITQKEWREEELIAFTREEEFFQSKYSALLPQELYMKMHILHEIDINGVVAFLKNIQIIVITMD